MFVGVTFSFVCIEVIDVSWFQPVRVSVGFSNFIIDEIPEDLFSLEVEIAICVEVAVFIKNVNRVDDECVWRIKCSLFQNFIEFQS